jgi:hypothetical protein
MTLGLSSSAAAGRRQSVTSVMHKSRAATRLSISEHLHIQGTFSMPPINPFCPRKYVGRDTKRMYSNSYYNRNSA